MCTIYLSKHYLHLLSMGFSTLALLYTLFTHGIIKSSSIITTIESAYITIGQVAAQFNEVFGLSCSPLPTQKAHPHPNSFSSPQILTEQATPGALATARRNDGTNSHRAVHDGPLHVPLLLHLIAACQASFISNSKRFDGRACRTS